jgi:Holliday junction resolvasome RuvABC endonuclease subunit
MAAVRIIGVDASLSATGIAVYHQDGREAKPWMSATTVYSAPPMPTERRMQLIMSRLWSVAGNGPQALNTFVAIEAPFVADPKKRSGETTLKLGGLHYLIRYGLFARNIRWVVLHHTALKIYATGAGNAGKAVTTEAANYHLRHLTHAGDDNQADACWLAAMAAHHYIGKPLHHGKPSHDLNLVLKAIDNWPSWNPWP